MQGRVGRVGRVGRTGRAGTRGKTKSAHRAQHNNVVYYFMTRKNVPGGIVFRLYQIQ